MLPVQTCLRVLMLMGVAVEFIVQQITHPLITVWVAIGEYLHCASYVLLLELICSNKGLRGLSMKTQICFLFVHWFRYLDSFFHTHPNKWITWLKVFYMAVSALLVLSLIFLRNTWERKKDTCSLLVLLFISILLGTINYFVDGNWPSSALERFFHYFWILSHYLQGFAMLPQFVFCYRDPENKDSLLTAYVIVLGSYRLAYAINWIERAYKERFFYVSGPLGLSILLIFLSDYLLFKCRKKSCISSFVLRIDDTIAVSEQPLLQAVYGSSYERISLAELSSSARVPPIEIDLQHVHVIGRPCHDIHALSTTSPLSRAALETSINIEGTAVGSSKSSSSSSSSRSTTSSSRSSLQKQQPLYQSDSLSAAASSEKKSAAAAVVAHRTAWLDDEEDAAASRDTAAGRREGITGLYHMDTDDEEEGDETETAIYTATQMPSPSLPAALVSYNKDSSQTTPHKTATNEVLMNSTTAATAVAANTPTSETETATTNPPTDACTAV